MIVDFYTGDIKGMAREFRGGELVGMMNYRRGIVWRIEARQETRFDYWNGAVKETKLRHERYRGVYTDGAGERPCPYI